MIHEYEHFKQTLQHHGNPLWLNTWFDTLKSMFFNLNIAGTDARLAMNVTRQYDLNVNIGQRWVSRVYGYGLAGLILPITVHEKALDCTLEGYFTKRKMPDAKWVITELQTKTGLKAKLYSAWEVACAAELEKCRKSGYRRFHSALFYDAVMQPGLRKVLFEEVFTKT